MNKYVFIGAISLSISAFANKEFGSMTFSMAKELGGDVDRNYASLRYWNYQSYANKSIIDIDYRYRYGSYDVNGFDSEERRGGFRRLGLGYYHIKKNIISKLTVGKVNFSDVDRSLFDYGLYGLRLDVGGDVNNLSIGLMYKNDKEGFGYLKNTDMYSLYSHFKAKYLRYNSLNFSYFHVMPNNDRNYQDDIWLKFGLDNGFSYNDYGNKKIYFVDLKYSSLGDEGSFCRGDGFLISAGLGYRWVDERRSVKLVYSTDSVAGSVYCQTGVHSNYSVNRDSKSSEHNINTISNIDYSNVGVGSVYFDSEFRRNTYLSLNFSHISKNRKNETIISRSRLFDDLYMGSSFNRAYGYNVSIFREFNAEIFGGVTGHRPLKFGFRSSGIKVLNSSSGQKYFDYFGAYVVLKI